MIVLEQGSEADGASPQEGRGSQARLRLQEAARGTGQDDSPSFKFLAPSGASVSLCPSVCSGHKLSRKLNLHLSGINLQAVLSALSLKHIHTSSD